VSGVRPASRTRDLIAFSCLFRDSIAFFLFI
jgi:hypothetical protein